MACPYNGGGSGGGGDGGDEPVLPRRGKEPVYYHDYLQLDKVLDAQAPKSLEVGGQLAHDEHLFIVIHQSYELWFKQILFDLESCRAIFGAPTVQEKSLGLVVRRLERTVRTLSVLLDTMGILETMTPLDFLDFRDYLFPASGFQSVQFRKLENMLGLRPEFRLRYARADYSSRLSAEHAAEVTAKEREASIFELVNQWLERTPFLRSDDFNFWERYEASVRAMFAIEREQAGDDAERVAEVDESERAFLESVFDEAKYEELVRTGKRRLSFKATQAALLINLYRDEPIFQMPFKLLTALVDMDQGLTAWRQRHASMVHRMLGMKSGTGGSSGFHYLKATATHHKVFTDLCDMSTYLIPRSMLPRLPDSVVSMLRFHYSGGGEEKESKK